MAAITKPAYRSIGLGWWKHFGARARSAVTVNMTNRSGLPLTVRETALGNCVSFVLDDAEPANNVDWPTVDVDRLDIAHRENAASRTLQQGESND